MCSWCDDHEFFPHPEPGPSWTYSSPCAACRNCVFTYILNSGCIQKCGNNPPNPDPVPSPNPCLTGNCDNGGGGTTESATDSDPNRLTGPAGFGIENYVIESNLFAYEISFENQTNATAPAQIVQITDPLSTNLDWQTFQLTEIAFGNVFIPIAPNIQHFQTNLPFSLDGVNFQVQIEAGISLASGQMFANFFSIDPLTGLPPEAEVGFLPPEDGTGRGMGAGVLYHPAHAAPTGRHSNSQCRLYSVRSESCNRHGSSER